MPLHSCAEMQWIAGVMSLHGMHVTKDSVIEAVTAGDAFLLSDAVVNAVVYEYDEAYYSKTLSRRNQPLETQC